jgi:membrane protease YdiL (CAAX protease family)
MKDANEEMAAQIDDGSHDGVATNDKSLAAWEIASVTLSFLIAEWMVMPFAGNSKLVAALPVGLAFALILLSHHARGESAREIGWRLDNFGKAARLLILPMLVGIIVLVGIGLTMKSLRFDRQQVLEWAVWLPLWGMMQQYVLQGFINRRAQMLYGRGSKSILLVALIFALLHLPNPWLSVATFAGGLVWAYVYQRTPNLLALALSHALMSMLLALSLPPATINSLRVGIKYFG